MPARKTPPINQAAMEGEDLSAEETAALEAESTSTELIEYTQGQPATPTEPAKETAPTGEAPKEPVEEPRIPKGRLDEVINERNDLRQKYAELQGQWNRLDERRKVFQEQQDTAKAAADAAKAAAERPDPAIDPLAARLWDLEQRERQREAQFQALQEQYNTGLQQTAQQTEQIRINQWVQADVARVRSIHPDYELAYNHLRNTRIALNKALGYNDQQAAALWDVEAAAYTRQAAQNGVSIADFAYSMAQSLGYQPPQANGNGTAAPPAAPAAQNGAGRDRVEQIRKAQQMQGLGGRQTGVQQDQYTSIKNMTAQQFNDYLDSLGGEDGWLDAAAKDPQLHKAIEAKFQELG